MPIPFRNSCRPSVVASGSTMPARPCRGRAARTHAVDDQARGSGWVELLDQLDLTARQQAVQGFDIGLLELELGRRGRDLGVCDHADLLPAWRSDP